MQKQLTLRERYPGYKSIVASEYFCELTEEMDQYMLYKSDHFRTYLMYFGDRMKQVEAKPGHVWILRAPGSTRGYVLTNPSGIIDTIMFYEEMCYGVPGCYDKSMEEIKDKYLGLLLVKPEG